MTEEDVLRVILKTSPEKLTIKSIVSQLKHFVEKDVRNKSQMFSHIKRLVNRDGKSDIVTLKKEYRDWKDPQL